MKVLATSYTKVGLTGLKSRSPEIFSQLDWTGTPPEVLLKFFPLVPGCGQEHPPPHYDITSQDQVLRWRKLSEGEQLVLIGDKLTLGGVVDQGEKAAAQDGKRITTSTRNKKRTSFKPIAKTPKKSFTTSNTTTATASTITNTSLSNTPTPKGLRRSNNDQTIRILASSYTKTGLSRLKSSKPNEFSELDWTGVDPEALIKLFPYEEKCGKLHPPPHYDLSTNEQVLKWRNLKKKEQQRIIDNPPPPPPPPPPEVAVEMDNLPAGDARLLLSNKRRTRASTYTQRGLTGLKNGKPQEYNELDWTGVTPEVLEKFFPLLKGCGRYHPPNHYDSSTAYMVNEWRKLGEMEQRNFIENTPLAMMATAGGQNEEKEEKVEVERGVAGGIIAADDYGDWSNKGLGREKETITATNASVEGKATKSDNTKTIAAAKTSNPTPSRTKRTTAPTPKGKTKVIGSPIHAMKTNNSNPEVGAVLASSYTFQGLKIVRNRFPDTFKSINWTGISSTILEYFFPILQQGGSFGGGVYHPPSHWDVSTAEKVWNWRKLDNDEQLWVIQNPPPTTPTAAAAAGKGEKERMQAKHGMNAIKTNSAEGEEKQSTKGDEKERAEEDDKQPKKEDDAKKDTNASVKANQDETENSQSASAAVKTKSESPDESPEPKKAKPSVEATAQNGVPQLPPLASYPIPGTMAQYNNLHYPPSVFHQMISDMLNGLATPYDFSDNQVKEYLRRYQFNELIKSKKRMRAEASKAAATARDNNMKTTVEYDETDGDAKQDKKRARKIWDPSPCCGFSLTSIKTAYSRDKEVFNKGFHHLVGNAYRWTGEHISSGQELDEADKDDSSFVGYLVDVTKSKNGDEKFKKKWRCTKESNGYVFRRWNCAKRTTKGSTSGRCATCAPFKGSLYRLFKAEVLSHKESWNGRIDQLTFKSPKVTLSLLRQKASKICLLRARMFKMQQQIEKLDPTGMEIEDYLKNIERVRDREKKKRSKKKMLKPADESEIGRPKDDEAYTKKDDEVVGESDNGKNHDANAPDEAQCSDGQAGDITGDKEAPDETQSSDDEVGGNKDDDEDDDGGINDASEGSQNKNAESDNDEDDNEEDDEDAIEEDDVVDERYVEEESDSDDDNSRNDEDDSDNEALLNAQNMV